MRTNARSDHEPMDAWVEGKTIGQALREVAARYPEHEALVFSDDGFRATYAEYDKLVDEVALGLLAIDIQRGDHVGVWSTNRPEWVLLQMATARVGAVLVTVNPAFQEGELQYLLQQSKARALFLTDRFKTSDYFSRLQAVVPELATCEPGMLQSTAAPWLHWVVSFPDEHEAGMLAWKELIGRGRSVDPTELLARERSLDPYDPINLQYTSGTTGFPKGAMLSHRNLLLNAWYVGECQHLQPSDRVCSPVPFYHCFGCVIGALCCMVRGAALLSPAEHFDALATLECIERERASAVYGVPTMFIALLEEPSFASRDLTSLRTGVMAGAPCPVELMKKVIEDMGVTEITIAYGLTECSPCATQTQSDDSFEHKVNTVGKAIPGVEVAVIDPDTGRRCDDGVQGEICIRGHNVMIGYFDMPEATSSTIDADGWLHSGDLGVRDEDGFYRITGRIKDMIIRGGENIYPREIEEALYLHADVEEAEVVGVPDERFGEEVCAFVKLHDNAGTTTEQLRQHCRTHLAHFKVPRFFVIVEEFPTTVSGKVQKFKLRETAAKMREAGELEDAVRVGG